MVIYLLIPAFNEAPHLAGLLARVDANVGGRPVRIVVVCDGSTDGTCRVAADNGAELVELWPNSGKGSAVRAGAARLTGREFDAVVLMDADGQHNPEDLSRLIDPVLAEDCDIAIGSRYVRDPSRGITPFNRYVVRTVFTRVLRQRLRQPVTDPFSGYRCMSPRAFREVRLSGNSYEGELEVRFEAELHGLNVLEVPIDRIYPKDHSKMGVPGPLRGRLSVIGGYVRTTHRKTRELAALRRRASVA